MPDQMETIGYEGKNRRVIGRLRYLEPPDVGAIVGPNAWGEKCVVLATVDGVTLVGLAIQDDMARAAARRAALGPASLLEASMILDVQAAHAR